jgi:short subunit dehydrogenase-like uncharacterized protein
LEKAGSEEKDMAGYLIYGANGYTGTLIARMAVGRGQRPLLAGRNEVAVTHVARHLGLEARVFGLDDPTQIQAGLTGMSAVLNCAGPFTRTAQPLADACLRTGVHYLDVTGEVEVFEGLAARDAEARAAGVMLLPGVGFDVVPSDCLAVHLKRRLPSATHLTLAFQVKGGLSRGTATTMAENVHKGGLVRKDGVLTRVPAAWRTRRINFGRGPVPVMMIPWGDVSTAWYSTGIPNIEVYMAARTGQRLLTWASRYVGWLLGTRFVQHRLKNRIEAGLTGPTDEERARGASFLWGEVHNDLGGRAVARLRGPEGYTLTALTALAVVERVLGGQWSAGFQTPGKVYGPDFILELPGVERADG